MHIFKQKKQFYIEAPSTNNTQEGTITASYTPQCSNTAPTRPFAGRVFMVTANSRPSS